MKAFIVMLVCFLVGCSGDPTQAESSAGGSPPAPEYSLGGGGGGDGNPCGRTYKLTFPLPDGGYVTKYVPVYCTIWDGDRGDPPPDVKRKWLIDPNPVDIVQLPQRQQER